MSRRFMFQLFMPRLFSQFLVSRLFMRRVEAGADRRQQSIGSERFAQAERCAETSRHA
jgi:hypothetical protein